MTNLKRVPTPYAFLSKIFKIDKFEMDISYAFLSKIPKIDKIKKRTSYVFKKIAKCKKYNISLDICEIKVFLKSPPQVPIVGGIVKEFSKVL